MKKIRTQINSRITVFESTNYYCSNCGSKEVWRDDCYDYYQGAGLHCVNCLSQWQEVNGIRDSDFAELLRSEIVKLSEKEKANEETKKD